MEKKIVTSAKVVTTVSEILKLKIKEITNQTELRFIQMVMTRMR